MSSLNQKSFSAGEISPDLFSRTDTTKFTSGLRACRNFIVQRFGGATNRSGSKFIAEVKDSTKTVRLIPFVFNTLQTYVLEFGDLYIRFIRSGGYVYDVSNTITGITQATEGVVTSNAHGFTDGQEVNIISVLGMTEINGRNFKVSDATANTFKLKLMDGATYLDTSGYTAYTSSGLANRVYEISTPYVEADLSELKYIQSADVMTIAHHNYPVAELSRTGDASWSIDAVIFAATISKPTGTGITHAAGTVSVSYKSTAIDASSFEESEASAIAASAVAAYPVTYSCTVSSSASEYYVYKALNGIYGFIGSAAAGTSFVDTGITPDVSITPPNARNPFGTATTTAITGVSLANPCVVTSVAHGLSIGDVVLIKDIVGTTQLNNKYFFVRAVPTVDTFSLNGFTKSAINSTAYTAWTSGGTVGKANDYLPSTCAYFQQRLGFANTLTEPEKEWFSKTGLFHNFNISTPLQDDDAVTFQLVGRQVNGVHHILDIGKLATMTQVGEWTIEGDASGVLLPTAINAKQQSYNGSDETISPVIVDATALYVQARGSVLRDFNFNFQSDGYRGNDLSLFSAHLFDNYTILDIAYQKIPHSNVWLVRSDGTLLGLTYVVEQNILGWHRHDFENGLVENVCSIPEGNEDALYLVVLRTIDGRSVRYMERLSTRQIDLVEDSIFVDSAVSYDGRYGANFGYGVIVTGGTTWAYTEELTLTVDYSIFSFVPNNIGNEIHMTGSDGTIIRFEITGYTSGTEVTARPNRTVPVSMRGVSITDWSFAIKTMSGLDHLEGEEVSIFADGFVVSNPNNASYDTVTVSNGAISLSKAYGVIHVGLPITSDLETLDIDTAQGETISDKKKTVNRVSLRVVNSRGIWVGGEPPSDDTTDPLEGLVEVKLRNTESMDEPMALKTEVVDVINQAQWNSNGRVFIRQVDPVPLTISAVTVDGVFPFGGGG